MAIIEDILEGIPNKEKVIVEQDRASAIHKAIDDLDKNEVLLVLGKGDEIFQEVGDSIHRFNDKDVILDYLNKKD